MTEIRYRIVPFKGFAYAVEVGKPNEPPYIVKPFYCEGDARAWIAAHRQMDAVCDAFGVDAGPGRSSLPSDARRDRDHVNVTAPQKMASAADTQSGPNRGKSRP